MTNLINHTFRSLSRKSLKKEIMDYQSREKYWQKVAGHMARIAHWALMELLDSKPGESTRDEAEEKLNEVAEVLPMDEENE